MVSNLLSKKSQEMTDAVDESLEEATENVVGDE